MTEKTARYRAIVRKVVEQDAQENPANNPAIQAVPICDDSRGHYLLVYLGWVDGYRANDTVFHLSVHDDQVWIERDGTEEGIAHVLVQAGIPAEDIVLAFQDPRYRASVADLINAS